MSIRIKLFGFLSLVVALACGFALYGIRGISTTGNLVVQLYDGPLMGINHARAAHAELNEARLVVQQGQSVEASGEAAARLEKLVKSIFDDLGVVRERIAATNVRAVQETAESKVRVWSNAVLKILKPAPGGLTELPATVTVTKLGQEAVAAVDDVVARGAA